MLAPSTREKKLEAVRPNRAEFDLSALRHNMRALRAISGPEIKYIAALKAIHDELIPALEELKADLNDKADELMPIIKTGRTHLQDATPVRLGQEFLGHASISTTQVYTHLTDDHLKEEYERTHPRAN